MWASVDSPDKGLEDVTLWEWPVLRRSWGVFSLFSHNHRQPATIARREARAIKQNAGVTHTVHHLSIHFPRAVVASEVGLEGPGSHALGLQVID